MTKIQSFLAFLSLLPSLASAQLDCIVPTREEGYEASRPNAEAIRRAARAVEAIVKRNALFMAGNEPVRVRTSISYHGDRWLSASVITTAYNKKAWVGEGCQVSKFADRGGGLSDGQIAVYINDPDAMLGGKVGDSELPARLAPRRVGELAGFPLYGRGDDADTMVMMSASSELPWMPVTIAEALDWREREIAKMRADEARVHAKSNDAVAGTRAEFDAYRASFSAAQLREPATISGATYRKTVMRVDDPKGRPMVRVNTAVAQRDPGRIKLLVIPQYSVATDEDHQWQVASRNALDYAALAALLAK